MLSGTGAYTGQKKTVVMCAVRRAEVYKAREIVKRVDPSAFIIVGDANEIIGEGFDSESQLKELIQ